MFVEIGSMSAEKVVSKLLIVENDPKKVWAALNNNYGHNYFKTTIEEDYGITADFKDRMLKEFSEKVFQQEYDNNKRLNELRKDVNEEVNKLQDLYQD